MPSNETFGRLEQVPLREGWGREDSDFTPWLAQEDAIGLLSETIGLELEVLQEEASVGPFRADIVARDTLSGSLVVIENQLERTDHSHLGQTLTYAAGLDAITMVWIAARFTEEHRAALDWLNRITHEEFRFFGIEIQLWRIGESSPAPKFNLVAQPNDWSKSVRETAKSGGTKLTGAKQAQVEFWADFGTALEASSSRRKVPKPQASSWVGYGIGRTGAGLFPTVGVTENWVMVKLGVSEPLFHLLSRDKDQIEQEIGASLDWRAKPNRKESSIEVRRSGDLSAPAERRALIRWLIQTSDRFDQAFRPRLKALDEADWDPDQE